MLVPERTGSVLPVRPGAPPRGVRAGSWALTGAAAAGLLVVGFGPEPLRGPVGLAGVLVGLAALGFGTARVARPGDRAPWQHMCVAGLLFLTGIAIRIIVPETAVSPPTPMAMIPNVVVIPGYLMSAYAFAGLLRRRRADEDDPAWVDAVLVGVASALLAWTYLVQPSIERTGLPLIQLANSFFPVIDVVLVVLVAQLALAGGVRAPTLWLLIVGSASLFGGDFLYSVRDGNLADLPAHYVDALYTAAFLLFGAATLHPSMRTLTEPQQIVVRDLSRARTVVIAVVLLIPIGVMTAEPVGGALDRWVRAVLCSLIVLALLFRVVRSNNSRARAEDAIRRRATHDALTDLPNRELLSETIATWGDRAVADGQEISLLFIDLDRFKMINDHWGHRVGDELLCAVAGRLSANLRGTDLVCRTGGDEFVVVLAGPSARTLAEATAGRVLDLFSRPFLLSVGEVVTSASIGVASAVSGAEALELIRDADTAMYEAKATGRNTYARFDTRMRDDVRDRMTLEQELRGALERGELYPTYQPIVDLSTGELDGYETLMRWRHPTLGLISPLRFVPIAEETGLIVDAGAWLLREAATQLATWRAERGPGDRPLHISVNISVRQLRDRELVAIVRDVLDETGLPPDALWLEITESGVMEDLETALATLDELRGLGVTLAVDDFGTGYSSLSYLNRLPVGIVKLDRSFVSEVGEQGANESIVRAVLAMAGALDLKVVAEGVETDVQRDWLRDQGCDLGQGWLYGKPVPASEIG
ncbi:diguanylate cyclase (GGDEF) domain-containing protein [Cryptosporangium arvum DSM 44712]|uniref:Diguanylate cyclase (GGDEF) domain-containing protein n=1 Tax=Cryptosporangium arvum DSM 44712 TaxID=927661 RepID=A0A011ALT1_9ACTN|nr:diguanylate cyclase (GGDEF) domain-containing protein [Cryptosporangium arvum DSM 44712]